MATHGAPALRQARPQVRVVSAMSVSQVPGTLPRCLVLLSLESIALIGAEEAPVAIIMKACVAPTSTQAHATRAAPPGTPNLPITHYDNLAALSLVVRKEVLTGELSRQLKANESVTANESDVVVGTLISPSLSEVVTGIQDPSKLAEQAANARAALKLKTLTSSPRDPTPTSTGP